ncbi:MAG: CPBP family intramembrane metalloprotease [Candidatus Omnitrophica bacterium]|nr:CPBP family intramembrane metalloprotease [Candidatus Omnitrophota bacterium]
MRGWVWRERWHVAAVIVALVTLVGQHRAASRVGDAWEADRRQIVRQLAQDAGQWSAERMKGVWASSPSLAWRMALLVWGFAGAVVAGCVALAVAWRRRARGHPWLRGPHPRVAAVPWGVWDLIAVFAWLVCGMQAIALGLGLAFRAWHLAPPDRYLAAMVQTMIMDGLALVVVALVIVRRHRASVKMLGLQPRAAGRQMLIGLRGYLLWLPLFVATVAGVMVVSRWWSVTPEPQTVVVMLLQESRPRLLLLLMAMVAIVGPLAEEIVFRGVVYAALRRRWGVRWGVLGSAALFAGLHLDPIAFAPIFVMGGLLGWLYEQTGSLIPSMTVHFVHNSVMLLVALTVRDAMRALGVAP